MSFTIKDPITRISLPPVDPASFAIKDPTTRISLPSVNPGRVSLIGGTVSTGIAIKYREYPAAEAIGGHRVVALRGGQLQYATNTDPLDAFLTIGVTSSATSLAGLCRSYDNEVLVDSSFSFVVGGSVYLTTNGLMSQSPPSTGLFNLRIGTAIATDQLWVQIQTPVFF